MSVAVYGESSYSSGGGGGRMRAVARCQRTQVAERRHADTVVTE